MEVTMTSERSACVQALLEMPVTPEHACYGIDNGGLERPRTNVFYTVSERVYAQNAAVQEWRYDDWRERRTTATANVAARRGERAA